MLKSTGKRVECGQCEAKTVKVSLKKSINPGRTSRSSGSRSESPPEKHRWSGAEVGGAWDLEVEGTGLLDGGATHPLRQGTSDEIKNAVQWLKEPRLYQNPMNGLVLSETPVESIVPPRGLVELGYAITWSRAGCVVKHPRLGKTECWL